MPCLGTNKASIDQHGAEGPDALQVLIKDPMILPDLGGLRSLAAAEPIKAPTLGACLVSAQTKLVSTSQHGAERPDALQVLRNSLQELNPPFSSHLPEPRPRAGRAMRPQSISCHPNYPP